MFFVPNTSSFEHLGTIYDVGSFLIFRISYGQIPPLQDFSTSYISKNKLLIMPLFAILFLNIEIIFSCPKKLRYQV